MGLDGVNEMLGIRYGEIFYSEIIDAEDESGSFCTVFPEAGGERHGFVPGRIKFLDELIESNDGGLFETVHASPDFEVDIAVVGDVDVIAWVVPDLLGDDGLGDAHVLKIGHGGAEKVVFDIETEVAGAVFGIRNGAVDMELGVEHRDGWGAGIAWVVELVTTSRHSDPVGF